MAPQMPSLGEWFVAIDATVLFLSTVSQLMPLQNASLTEWFVTLCTSVLLLSTMSQQMPSQMPSLGEWFVAMCTCVRLLSRVSEQMCGQFAGGDKRLDAHGARVFIGHVQNINCSPLLVENNWGGNDPHFETFVHFPFPKVNLLWSIYFFKFSLFSNVNHIQSIFRQSLRQLWHWQHSQFLRCFQLFNGNLLILRTFFCNCERMAGIRRVCCICPLLIMPRLSWNSMLATIPVY